MGETEGGQELVSDQSPPRLKWAALQLTRIDGPEWRVFVWRI
jgi:hypothetical protein